MFSSLPLINNSVTTQPANIGRQDVLRTSASDDPRTSTKDPIWRSQGRPQSNALGRFEMASEGRLNLTSKGRPWKVDLGRPQEILRTSPRRPWKHILGTMSICWMSLNFSLLFFRNLFDWPNLSKSNSILMVYLEPSPTSRMALFLQN